MEEDKKDIATKNSLTRGCFLVKFLCRQRRTAMGRFRPMRQPPVVRLADRPSFMRSVLMRVHALHGFEVVGPGRNNILKVRSSAPLGLWDEARIVFVSQSGDAFIASVLHVSGTRYLELTLSAFISFLQEGDIKLIEGPGTHVLHGVETRKVPFDSVLGRSSTTPCNLPSP